MGKLTRRVETTLDGVLALAGFVGITTWKVSSVTKLGPGGDLTGHQHLGHLLTAIAIGEEPFGDR